MSGWGEEGRVREDVWQGGVRVISRAARLRSLIGRFLWTIDPLMAFPSFRPAVCHYGCSQPLEKKFIFSWYQQENRKWLGKQGDIKQWFKETQLWINSPGRPLESRI